MTQKEDIDLLLNIVKPTNATEETLLRSVRHDLKELFEENKILKNSVMKLADANNLPKMDQLKEENKELLETNKQLSSENLQLKMKLKRLQTKYDKQKELLKNKIWSKELEELVKIFAETFLED